MVTAIVLLTVTKNKVNEAAEKIAEISETMSAFRVYSRHDLETMFSIGVE